MSAVPASVRARLLKAATGELVALLGGIEGAGATLERGKSVVGRWVNRNDAEHWIGIADVAALESVAGRAVVTELLCKLAGGLFVPHIDLAADEGSVGWLVMRLSKELGEVSGVVADAGADGEIDAGEAASGLAQLDDVDKVSAQLRAVFNRIIAEGEAGA